MSEVNHLHVTVCNTMIITCFFLEFVGEARKKTLPYYIVRTRAKVCILVQKLCLYLFIYFIFKKCNHNNFSDNSQKLAKKPTSSALQIYEKIVIILTIQNRRKVYQISSSLNRKVGLKVQ